MDYKPTGDKDREVKLKSDIWVKVHDIPELLKSVEAFSAIRFYIRWRTFGFPYGPWGLNPNVLVEVVEILDPLDRLYHPKMI